MFSGVAADIILNRHKSSGAHLEQMYLICNLSWFPSFQWSRNDPSNPGAQQRVEVIFAQRESNFIVWKQQKLSVSNSVSGGGWGKAKGEEIFFFKVFTSPGGGVDVSFIAKLRHPGSKQPAALPSYLNGSSGGVASSLWEVIIVLFNTCSSTSTPTHTIPPVARDQTLFYLLCQRAIWAHREPSLRSLCPISDLIRTALLSKFSTLKYLVATAAPLPPLIMDIEALKEQVRAPKSRSGAQDWQVAQWSEVEDRDGLRLSWNVFPSSRMVIPSTN